MLPFYYLFSNINNMILNITGGKVQIDDEDYDLVSQYKWHKSDTGYAVWRSWINNKKQTVRMHRLVTNCPADKVIDHINHDPLDNRKVNLRICTQKDNLNNKKNQGRGYWYHRQNNNWVVEIQGIHRGTFNSETEAAEFAESVRRGLVYKKVKPPRIVCKYGHSLEDAYEYGGYGKRCKVCQSRTSKEYYRRKHGG